MPGHRIGTREQWQAARDDLARLEAEQAERNEEIKTKRLDLPWVVVEKEYEFDTEDGRMTLADLFDGRSQLLGYNIMFGPGYTLGACPGCTGLADGLDGSLVHLNHRDVTLLCFSRAPIERLTAYKRRMGWQFRYVSTYNTDFAFDFGLALTEQQAEQIPELQALTATPPGWLQQWSGQIGAELTDGLRENPGWIAFARENGTVYHTYTVTAPDPFVAPYFSFLARFRLEVTAQHEAPVSDHGRTTPGYLAERTLCRSRRMNTQASTHRPCRASLARIARMPGVHSPGGRSRKPCLR